MLIILLVGFILLTLLLLALCILPCVYFYAFSEEEETRSPDGKLEKLPPNKGTKKILIGHGLDPSICESKCKICQQAYDSDDVIIVLRCSKRHYFHQSCLHEWVTEK